MPLGTSFLLRFKLKEDAYFLSSLFYGCLLDDAAAVSSSFDVFPAFFSPSFFLGSRSLLGYSCRCSWRRRYRLFSSNLVESATFTPPHYGWPFLEYRRTGLFRWLPSLFGVCSPFSRSQNRSLVLVSHSPSLAAYLVSTALRHGCFLLFFTPESLLSFLRFSSDCFLRILSFRCWC